MVSSSPSYSVAGITLMHATLAGRQVLLARSGVGKVAAAATAAILAERVTGMILVGTAGGLGPNVNPGDVVIATELLQHEVQVESFGGEVVDVDGEPFMKFYGMSSSSAMDKHAGGVAEYRASEGKTVLLPYRGPVENAVRDILGGVRSTCTYVGASQLKELTKRTTFIRVREQENNVYGKE